MDTLNATLSDLLKNLLQDNLEIDITTFNGELTVEVYFDGDVVCEGSMQLRHLHGDLADWD